CFCSLHLREQCYHQVHVWRKHVGCYRTYLGTISRPVATVHCDVAADRNGVTIPTVCVGSLTSLHPFTHLKRLNIREGCLECQRSPCGAISIMQCIRCISTALA